MRQQTYFFLWFLLSFIFTLNSFSGAKEIGLQVPSKKYPTIQSAINEVQNKHKHGQNSKILIAPGTYKESIKIKNIMTSVSEDTTTIATAGFSLIGDQRPFVGNSYVHLGSNSNFAAIPGMGDHAVGVLLEAIRSPITGHSSIKVNVKNLNFTQLKIKTWNRQPGDIIKIRSNLDQWHERKIFNVTQDSIEYDGELVPVGQAGSALVMVPNVHIQGVLDNESTIFVGGVSTTLQGLWVSNDPQRKEMPSYMLQLEGHQVSNIFNCLFDKSVSIGMGTGNILMENYATIMGARYNKNPWATIATGNTVIGSGKDVGVSMFSHTTISEGSWNFFDFKDGLAVELLSTISILHNGIFQIVGSQKGLHFESTSVGYLTKYHFIKNKVSLESIDSFVYLGTFSKDKTFMNTINAADIPDSIGVASYRASNIFFSPAVHFSHVTTGMLAQNLSSIFTKSDFSIDSSFGENIAHNILVGPESVFNSEGKNLSSRSGIFTYPIDPVTMESFALESTFTNQQITHSKSVSLLLNPKIKFTKWNKYIGKTFTIINNSSAKHELKLEDAWFKSSSFNNETKMKAIFKSNNASITFLVLDENSVHVLNSNAIEFN